MWAPVRMVVYPKLEKKTVDRAHTPVMTACRRASTVARSLQAGPENVLEHEGAVNLC